MTQRSRVEAGFCTWYRSDPFTTEWERLENERNPATPDESTPREVAALEMLSALMEAAETDGLGEEDYDAPMGRDLERSVRPWIGELKVVGAQRREEGGSRQYRLYFAEPDTDRALLAALLGHKKKREMEQTVAGTNRPRSSGKQTKQIETAMGITIRWCKARDVGFRTI